MQSLLSGQTPGNRKQVAAVSLAELNDRIERVRNLGDRFAGVQLSQDVSGLRVESLSDRMEALSPGTR